MVSLLYQPAEMLTHLAGPVSKYQIPARVFGAVLPGRRNNDASDWGTRLISCTGAPIQHGHPSLGCFDGIGQTKQVECLSQVEPGVREDRY